MKTVNRSVPWTFGEGVSIPEAFKGFAFETVLMTPEQAQLILDTRNKHNRNLSITQSNRYKLNFERGEFDPFNGEFVKFDINGELIDGQNRLQGIVDTGKSQVITTLSGLDPEAKYRIDMGRNRSDGHLFQINDETNAAAKAGIVRMILQLEVWHDRPNLRVFGQTGRLLVTGEALARYGEDPVVRQAVDYGLNPTNRIPVLSRAVVGGLYYAFCKYGDPSTAARFLNDLRNDTAPIGSPIQVLRARLISSLAVPQSRFRHRDDAIALVIHAYNMWTLGATWERARQPAQFPRIGTLTGGMRSYHSKQLNRVVSSAGV